MQLFQTYEAPEAPAAVGPYSVAAEANGFVYFSAQLPIDPVTNELVGSSIEEQTVQVCKNIGAVLKATGLGYENVIKAVCYLQNMSQFSAFNAVYGRYFSRPVRVCVGVNGLARGALVEIEITAVRK